jgi:hypothetical protein
VQTGDIANTKIPPGARGSIIFEDKDLPNHSVKELVGTSKAGSQEGAADRMVCEEGVFTTETVVSLKDTANHKPHKRTYHAVLVESPSNLNP